MKKANTMTSMFLGALALALVSSVTGCASTTDENASEQAAVAGDEAALSTASAATKKAIKDSIGFFNGGDAKRTHAIKMTDAPAAVSTKLKPAYAKMIAALSDFGSESDLETGIYEVWKSKKNHTVIGYALWAYGDNGDAGQGLIRGFDLSGRQIVTEEDGWAED